MHVPMSTCTRLFVYELLEAFVTVIDCYSAQIDYSLGSPNDVALPDGSAAQAVCLVKDFHLNSKDVTSV